MQKIHNTIFALVFVTLMIALPMTLQSVAAEGPSGHSFSKDTYVQYGGDYDHTPCYAECEHTNLNGADNMMVGLGVVAHYTEGIYPRYGNTNWDFMTQAGWCESYETSPVRTMPPMGCIFDVDFGMGSAYHSIYYDYSWPGTWDDHYHYPYPDSEQVVPLEHFCWIIRDHFERDIDSRTSVSAMTQGCFFYISDPWTIEYHYAQTQIPPGQSAPVQSYAFLTAHQTGDW